MPEYPWYVAGEFDNLQQGDLFFNCPVPLPDSAVYLAILAAKQANDLVNVTTELLIATADIVVMSQSCDLARPDCTQVLVCAHQDASAYSRDRRSEIAKDRYVALHMIEECDLRVSQFSQRVLDFRTVYGLPKDYLLAIAQDRGPRARLLPPYREHVAQAFARYFMRVGLPRNLKSG